MTRVQWVVLIAGLAALGYAIYKIDNGIVALVVALLLVLVALTYEQPEN